MEKPMMLLRVLIVVMVVSGVWVGAAQTVTLTVSDEVLHRDVQRFGINLGAPNDYGAENFMRNMIPNPGFESGLYGMVVSVLKARGTKVQAEFWSTEWHTPNIGQPEDFWTGGAWEIPSTNESGTIVGFTHEDNRYTWILDKPVDLAPLDVMYVRTEVGRRANAPRPGSPGEQSLYIDSPGEPWKTVHTMHFDAYGRQGDKSAGKLRVLKGPHRLSFWAKGPGVIAPVLNRGGQVLFEKKYQLTDEWAQYEDVFEGKDVYEPGDVPPLQFGWKVLVGKGFYLDDLFLGPVGEGAFADELVAALKQLRPGVVRAWQMQGGETLANQLAEPFARKTHEYRIRHRRPGLFSYSLPEFLDLCRAVDALPWYVVPPTFTLDDMRGLAAYLGHQTDFATIYVEFGNEAWGTNSPHDDPFAGASFHGGARLGQAAARAFEAFGDVPGVVKIIGGQAAWPGQNEHIAKASNAHDQIVIAPYFGILKEHWEHNAGMFYPLYGRAYQDIRSGRPQQSRKWVSGVYEINFHTTSGANGDNDVVNAFVTSQAGGIALPLYMLLYQRQWGWQPQAVFTLAQYSAGGIRIWGVYRDIMATGRARPTALGMQLANMAIQGDMVRVKVGMSPHIAVPAINGMDKATEIPAVDAFAWRSGKEVSVYVTNLTLTRGFTLELDAAPEEVYALAHPDPLADNEDAETVRIEKVASWDKTLPPHSAFVLKWTEQ
jgi:hypothetical protein